MHGHRQEKRPDHQKQGNERPCWLPQPPLPGELRGNHQAAFQSVNPALASDPVEPGLDSAAEPGEAKAKAKHPAPAPAERQEEEQGQGEEQGSEQDLALE